MCICVYMYICIHVCIYVYISVCVHAYICICMCVSMSIYICICLHRGAASWWPMHFLKVPLLRQRSRLGLGRSRLGLAADICSIEFCLCFLGVGVMWPKVRAVQFAGASLGPSCCYL